MAETIREIMDTSPATVAPDASVEEVVAALREHQLPGLPVVDADGRCVGIVTEADLVLPDDEGDLHIPHYVNLFGGHRLPRVAPPLRGPPPQGVRGATPRT